MQVSLEGMFMQSRLSFGFICMFDDTLHCVKVEQSTTRVSGSSHKSGVCANSNQKKVENERERGEISASGSREWRKNAIKELMQDFKHCSGMHNP